MKYLRTIARAGLVSLLAVVMAFALVGCGTTGEPPFMPVPDDGSASVVRDPTDVFSRGDLVIISYSGLGASPDRKQHEERVKEDGTITPPDIGTVKAEGKTAGELQSDLQKEYDKYFRNLTVTVKGESRFYHVLGEVKDSGPKPYLGRTDVVKAITAAGGFTEFANTKKIRLTHPNGKTEFVNYEKALDDPRHNRAVYPGDQITVKRRLF